MSAPGRVGRPLRVAIVIPAHWTWRMGGSQQQAMLLIERLAMRHDVSIRYFAARTGDRSNFDDHELVSVAVVDKLHRYGFFWDYFKLSEELGRFDPDVIYQRVGCAFTGIAARFARRRGIPLVWHIASDSSCLPSGPIWPKVRRPHSLIESWLAGHGPRFADLIVAQTSNQADLLHSNHRRKPDYIIPNFQPVPPATNKSSVQMQICWIANLKELKRPELFVRLAEILSDQADCRFIMVGAPYGVAAQQNKFEARVRRCANLDYLGQLNTRQVGEILAKTHIAVNTSRWEGFSNVFIEAWLNSAPVLTLGIDPDGVFQTEELGYCCASVEEMAQRIREFASDRVKLQAVGELCRKYAIERHSLENADKLAAVLVEAGEKRLHKSIA